MDSDRKRDKLKFVVYWGGRFSKEGDSWRWEQAANQRKAAKRCGVYPNQKFHFLKENLSKLSGKPPGSFVIQYMWPTGNQYNRGPMTIASEEDFDILKKDMDFLTAQQDEHYGPGYELKDSDRMRLFLVSESSDEMADGDLVAELSARSHMLNPNGSRSPGWSDDGTASLHEGDSVAHASDDSEVSVGASPEVSEPPRYTSHAPAASIDLTSLMSELQHFGADTSRAKPSDDARSKSAAALRGEDTQVEKAIPAMEAMLSFKQQRMRGDDGADASDSFQFGGPAPSRRTPELRAADPPAGGAHPPAHERGDSGATGALAEVGTWGAPPLGAEASTGAAGGAAGSRHVHFPETPAASEGPAPKKPGFKKPGLGLGLQVGSQMKQDDSGWSTQKFLQDNAGAPRGKAEPPPSLQQIEAGSIIKVKELGRGQFGSVWLTRWKGVDCAMKELHHNDERSLREMYNEADTIAGLRHPCVIAFYGVVTDESSPASVIEYMRGGALSSGLERLRRDPRMKQVDTRMVRAGIALQCARGMEYLHSRRVVHFDLKCDNLLCDLRDILRPVVKVADLGLSKQKAATTVSGNMRGTLPWMAPELFPSAGQAGSIEDRVTEKVDVFSFAIVMWEIWTLGEQPYPGLGMPEILAGLMSGTLRPEIPEDCAPEWAALMQHCWTTDPHKRPTFAEIAPRLQAMSATWTHPELLAALEAGGSVDVPHN